MREFSSGFFVDLGKANFRMQEDTPLGVPTWDDMKKHIYILGGTGSGKSETLKRILDDLLQKEGEEQTAAIDCRSEERLCDRSFDHDPRTPNK